MKVSIHFLIEIILWIFPFLCVAHPHMFIDISTDFIMSDTGLGGIKISWKFDDMNSAWLMDEFDKNKDKAFNKAEIQTLYREAFRYSGKYNHFAIINKDGENLNFKDIKSFNATINSENLVLYSFFGICTVPVQDSLNHYISIIFRDPTNFVAFELGKTTTTTRAGNAMEAVVTVVEKDYTHKIILRLKKKS